jgi:hypothetical protein
MFSVSKLLQAPGSLVGIQKHMGLKFKKKTMQLLTFKNISNRIYMDIIRGIILIWRTYFFSGIAYVNVNRKIRDIEKKIRRSKN